MLSCLPPDRFASWFDKLFAPLVSFAIVETGADYETATDLVCDAREDAWRLLDRFDARTGMQGFTNWVYKILRFVCQDYRDRARHRVTTTPLCEECANLPAAPPPAAPSRKAIDDLPEELREVVALHLDGWENVDIAEMLDIHRNTVRNRLEKATLLLKRFVGRVDEQLLSELSKVATYSPPKQPWLPWNQQHPGRVIFSFDKQGRLCGIRRTGRVR